MNTPQIEPQAVAVREPMPVARPMPSPIELLEGAIRGGITAETVGVVERLAVMCREVRVEEAKTAFHRALFSLRKSMPAIYADRQVKTKSGEVAFSYCTPAEIKEVLEPHLQQNGFCTVVGQTMDEGRVTVTLTVIHEAGHSESRTYTCRVSPGTALMSPSQCDAAATTAAERQLTIKFFGLRTRIRAEDDARNEGGTITAEQAFELERRVKELNANVAGFLKLAGSATFAAILSGKYDVLDQVLRSKERMAK